MDAQAREKEGEFGTGQLDGSVYPVLTPGGGVKVNPIYCHRVDGFTSNSALSFGPSNAEGALMQRVNAIANIKLEDADLEKYPSIQLATFAKDPQGEAKMMAALQWIDRLLDEHEKHPGG